MPAGSSRRSTSRGERWLWALARAVALVGLLSAIALGFAWRFAEPDAEIGAVCGVRLGMTEDQAMAAFASAPAGRWARGKACGGLSLEWTRKEPGEEGVQTHWARLEMNEGMVVAIPVHTDDVSLSEGAVMTRMAVRQVRRTEAGSAVTVLARGCVSHAAEAEQIAIAALSR